MVIPFAWFSLHELDRDLAYARCLQSLPLQYLYMYFDFKANVFKLQITCKAKGESGGMCVGRQPTVER